MPLPQTTSLAPVAINSTPALSGTQPSILAARVMFSVGLPLSTAAFRIQQAQYILAVAVTVQSDPSDVSILAVRAVNSTTGSGRRISGAAYVEVDTQVQTAAPAAAAAVLGRLTLATLGAQLDARGLPQPLGWVVPPSLGNLSGAPLSSPPPPQPASGVSPIAGAVAGGVGAIIALAVAGLIVWSFMRAKLAPDSDREGKGGSERYSVEAELGYVAGETVSNNGSRKGPADWLWWSLGRTRQPPRPGLDIPPSLVSAGSGARTSQRRMSVGIDSIQSPIGQSSVTQPDRSAQVSRGRKEPGEHPATFDRPRLGPDLQAIADMDSESAKDETLPVKKSEKGPGAQGHVDSRRVEGVTSDTADSAHSEDGAEESGFRSVGADPAEDSDAEARADGPAGAPAPGPMSPAIEGMSLNAAPQQPAAALAAAAEPVGAPRDPPPGRAARGRRRRQPSASPARSQDINRTLSAHSALEEGRSAFRRTSASPAPRLRGTRSLASSGV